ncbi:MAG TPA: zinc-binding dehydrogenase [Cyclobacteriaceae bacterium]
MRAVYFSGSNNPLSIKEIEKPKLGKNQVLVKLRNAALNHHELWMQKEQEQIMQDQVILGSDGSGTVEAVEAEDDHFLIGKEVVINPSLDWGKNPAVQAHSFSILGYPANGTFSDYIAISKKQIFEKPEHLSFEEAAAIPLAGLTAYRALFTKVKLRRSEKVLITGIGGGVALFALQFALSFDARVYVTSSLDDKLAMARDMGASGGYNYKDPEWVKKISKETGGFDVIIDSAGGKNFSQLLELAYPGARIALYGRGAGTISDISPKTIFWKQLSIFGSTMGTEDEFLSMLDFFCKHQLKPIIDSSFPLENVADAFKRMDQGDQFGKIVLSIS